MTHLIPYVSLWVLLAAVVLGLALYRKFVSAHEEDRYVHISEGEARLIPHQVAVNHKIGVIDRCGEILTVVTLFAGIVLAVIYLYVVL
jgi:hypothetical protein